MTTTDVSVTLRVQLFIMKLSDGVVLVLEMDHPKTQYVIEIQPEDLKESYRQMVMTLASPLRVGDRMDILPLIRLGREVIPAR